MTTRKGSHRKADIPDDVLNQLSSGRIQSATLTEILAIDQTLLLQSVFPDIAPQLQQVAQQASSLGILKRMQAMADILCEAGIDVAQCSQHQADTVRGWACFMLAKQQNKAVTEYLTAIHPLADDPHFGVREWAWLAIRPHLVADLPEAIAQLQQWTVSPSAFIRRFACESIRPRGVWCSHIAALKKQPILALPILLPLRADTSTYVQDSVANWLNDAGKDNPNWVRELCADWQKGGDKNTLRICQRALRNLR